MNVLINLLENLEFLTGLEAVKTFLVLMTASIPVAIIAGIVLA